MSKGAGHLLVAAGLLLGGLRAQEAQDSSPPPPGYVPQQYVPLYSPSDSAAPAVSTAPAAAKPEQDDEESKPEPTFTMRPPSIQPRADGAPSSGFAPVVAGPPRGDAADRALDAGGGLPRVYAPGFRLGPFDVRPDIGMMGTYNDNIYLTSKSEPRVSDYIVSVSPSLELGWSNGDPGEPDATQLQLKYDPHILEFLDNPGNSSFNQDVRAEVQHRFSNLSLYGIQSYTHVSGGIIEAGDLVDQDIFNTFLEANYSLTPKVSTVASVNYSVADYTVGVGSSDLLTMLFVNYQVRPKLMIGVAASGEYVMPDEGEDQSAVGGALRATYDYSARTSFFAQIGGTEREYSHTYSNEDWGFQLGTQWQAAAKTAIYVNASRKTNSSALSANSDYTDTNLGVTVVERLVDTLSLNLTCSYDHANYFSTLTGAAQQTYDFYSLNPALVFHPSIWSDVGISYLYRQNFSTVATSEFTNNQVSLFSTLRF